MKEYTFIGWCSEYDETEVVVDLSNKDAALLERYGKKASVYWDGFENCEELQRIYEKVYKIAVDQITDEIREYGEDDHCEDENWRANNTYLCGVEFPREFEDELEDDIEESDDD